VDRRRRLRVLELVEAKHNKRTVFVEVHGVLCGLDAQHLECTPKAARRMISSIRIPAIEVNGHFVNPIRILQGQDKLH
jgi:hypothetical protein